MSVEILTQCSCGCPFVLKAVVPGTLSANANPDVQGAAVANLRYPKGEVKVAEALGYRSCQ